MKTVRKLERRNENRVELYQKRWFIRAEEADVQTPKVEEHASLNSVERKSVSFNR